MCHGLPNGGTKSDADADFAVATPPNSSALALKKSFLQTAPNHVRAIAATSKRTVACTHREFLNGAAYPQLEKWSRENSRRFAQSFPRLESFL
jgi:hypothetical protein